MGTRAGCVPRYGTIAGPLPLAGLGLFLALSQALALREAKVVSVLAYYSFALHLVHFPIKILLTLFVGSLAISSFALRIIVLLVLILAILLVACAAIARIPKVGGKILYMS